MINEWEEKEEISLKELDEMIRKMREKYDEYAEAKKKASELYGSFKEMELKVINALESVGKSKYFVDGLGTFSIVNKQVVTVPKENRDKEELFNYIKEKHGEDVLVSMLSIHSAKLNSFYNQEFENAEDKAMFRIPGLSDPVIRKEGRFLSKK